MTPRFLLKVSRPGLWVQTVWLYLLPTSQQAELVTSWRFWLGLVFVGFPLNLLVYGWNDIVDYEIDRLNPRKDSWFFGARGSRDQLRALPPFIAACFAPFLIAFAAIDWRVGATLAGMVMLNASYNLPRHGLRTRPPLELANQLGYLLVLLFSAWLNQRPVPPGGTILYLGLFCTHAHLMGEIMDLEPDTKSGRRTTATVLGAVPTKAVIILLVSLESALLIGLFDEVVMGAFLALGALWLLVDVLVYAVDRPYSQREYRLFGWALNLSGFASIAWLWWRGSLV